MNANKYNSEKGQAIVYLVLGLVVFLGFVALALDGGMALADRRHSQNAADASSLAGGGTAALSLQDYDIDYDNWNCGNIGSVRWDAEEAAINRASTNNFLIGRSLTIDHNVVVVECNNALMNKYLDVTVDISATTPSNFLQLIYPEALHNEVEAVTRIFPRTPLAYGNAIVGLNPDACGGNNGVLFSGNGDSLVIGGGVYSSGCLYGNGRPTVEISSTYGFSYSGEWIPGNTYWIPDNATYVPDPMPPDMYYIDPPICTDWYTEADIKNLAPDLPSGLYCFHNKVNFGGYDLTGVDITFYAESDLIFNGNSVYSLTAKTDPDASPALVDVLIYAQNNSGTCTKQTIQLNGTSNSTYTGIIYAPCAQVELSGTGDLIAFNSQIIGWNVKVTGDAMIELWYDRESFIILPSNIGLYR